jgi:hypothetical protein
VSHLGDKIFAIPYGAENGGGLIALGLCIVAGNTMYHRGQRPVLTIFLTTFGLTFLAAALRIYPYGGHNRLTQFLVPPMATSIGMGVAAVLSISRNANTRRRLTVVLLSGLATFGAGVCGRDVIHPYHHVHDEHHREFARRFWLDEPQMTTLCAFTDLHQVFCKRGWYAYYRCNQRIYSARHGWQRASIKHDFERLSRPLRLVVFRPPQRWLDPQALDICLKGFEPDFELAGHQTYEPCRDDAGFDKYGGYEVFRFDPRERAAPGEPFTERRVLSRK